MAETALEAAANNHKNQMDPAHIAYWKCRGYDRRPSNWSELVQAEQRRKRQDNPQANQMNPNSDAYWQSRGHSRRPADSQSRATEQAERRRLAGAYEHRTNQAASTSPEQRAARGNVNRVIGQVVKEHFGGSAHILKAGSIKKHTGIQTSDLDLLVKTPHPWSARDKSQLAMAFQNVFGVAAVTERSYMLTLVTQAGDVDVVPYEAEFLPTRNALPTGRFLNNPKGQQVVRGVKMRAQQAGLKIKGDVIERQTIKAQQKHPNLANYELENRVFGQIETGGHGAF